MTNTLDWKAKLEKRAVSEMGFGCTYILEETPIVLLLEKKGEKSLDVPLNTAVMDDLEQNGGFHGLTVTITKDSNVYKCDIAVPDIRYMIIEDFEKKSYLTKVVAINNDVLFDLPLDTSYALCAAMQKGIPLFCLKKILENPPNILDALPDETRVSLRSKFN